MHTRPSPAAWPGRFARALARTLALAVPCAALLSGCVAAREVKPPVREHRVESRDGTTLHWWERGRGSTTVLLIHGWTCDATFWDAQVDALAARYRVVTLDLAGHGFSGTPRRDWTMAQFGDDVVRVADAARAKRIVLVGHSMGGPVAIEAAKRLRGRVIGVVGVDTLRQDYFGDGSSARLEPLLAPFRQDFRAAVSGFVAGNFFVPQSDPALVQRIVGTMSSARPEVGVPALQALLTWDWRTAFEGFDVPLVLLNAAQPPTELRTLATLVPGVRVRTFDGVGHFPMMEQPQPFNVVLLEELARLGQPGVR
jgi:pimeloyl-ACP methyl ester carboxylesterase